MPDNEDKITMRRIDLYEWVIAHGCITFQLPEYKANVIGIENPHNGLRYWLNLPMDEKPVRDYTVFRTCMELAIEIPTCVTYMKSLHEKIKNTDLQKTNIRKKRRH